MKNQDNIVIKINDKRRPDFSGLVTNNNVLIKNFLDFTKRWDANSYSKIMEYLKTPSSCKRIILLWRNFSLAGYFSWNRIYGKSLKHKENKKLLIEKINFVDTQLLDFKKSILRNLPQKNSQGLLNKKVFLVGLGAIGGYMADSLVKIGAGLESDFVLVDNDLLETSNIGRHILGFQYCGKPKVLAFAEYLKNQTFSLSCKIQPEFKNISSFNTNFFEENKFDLIVDATGSIEVQEYLNETLQQLPREKRPILQHLWIFGNGECVQGLWVDPEQQAKTGGCICCLGSSENGLHQEYLPISEAMQPEQRIGVCSAFTPYAVSGGMMAASLGINMILEWLEAGKVTKNYQTRYSSIDHMNRIEDITLVGHMNCPFCGENKHE